MSNQTSALIIRVGTSGTGNVIRDLRSIATSSKALGSSLGGFSRVAGLLGANIAPGLSASLTNVSTVLMDVQSAARAAGIGIGGVATGVAAVTAAVATGVTWWQKYKAELNEIESEGALNLQSATLGGRLRKLLDENRDRLNPGEADELRREHTAATLQGGDAQRTVQARIRTRLAEVNLTDDAKKKLAELDKIGLKALTDRLDGFAKEEEAEYQSHREKLAHMRELASAAKTTSDRERAEFNFQLEQQRHEHALAEIKRRETEEAAKVQREQDERHSKILQEDYQWELKLSELEKQSVERARVEADRVRSEKISNIGGDWRMTDVGKFNALAGVGVPSSQLGPNPGSLTDQMTAQWVALQNSIGTVAQNIAGTIAGTIGTAIDSISNGITGLIMRTHTWGSAMLQIGSAIATEFISGIVRSFVAFSITKAKELILHKTVETAKTAASISGATARSGAALGEASAEAVSTGAKAAGSVAKIPYVGWAMAIAAFGSVIAMIASASSAAKREYGGPMESGKPYFVGERGPELVVPKSDGMVIPANITSQIMAGMEERETPASPQVNVKVIPVVNMKQAALEAMSSPAGTRNIIHAINNNRDAAGLGDYGGMEA